MKFLKLLIVFLLFPIYSFAEVKGIPGVEENASLMLILAILCINYYINFLLTKTEVKYRFVKKFTLIIFIVNSILGLIGFITTWNVLSPDEFHWEMGIALVINFLVLIIVFSDYKLSNSNIQNYKIRAITKSTIILIAYPIAHFFDVSIAALVFGVFLLPAIDNLILFLRHKYLPNIGINDIVISISIPIVLFSGIQYWNNYKFEEENKKYTSKHPNGHITNKEGFGEREFWINEKKINFVDEVITDNNYNLNIFIENNLQYTLKFNKFYDPYSVKAALVKKLNSSNRIDSLYVLYLETGYNTDGIKIHGISGYGYEKAILIDKNGIQKVNEIK